MHDAPQAPISSLGACDIKSSPLPVTAALEMSTAGTNDHHNAGKSAFTAGSAPIQNFWKGTDDESTRGFVASSPRLLLA